MSDRRDIDSETEKPSEELAKAYEWDGKPLLPFSIGRQTAWLRLGVTAASDIEAASALVRLCQLEPEEVTKIRGAGVARFLFDLEDWMEKQGVGLGADKKAKTNALVALYDEIIANLYDAQKLAPVAQGGASSGNG